jgi:hypothetical protein
MPTTFNDELEREDVASDAAAVDDSSDEEPPPDEDEVEDLLELDANDQLRMLILESHALSVTATQVRNELEMLHSRAFRLAAEWKLASSNLARCSCLFSAHPCAVVYAGWRGDRTRTGVMKQYKQLNRS